MNPNVSKTRLRLILMNQFYELVKSCDVESSEIDIHDTLTTILELYIADLQRLEDRQPLDLFYVLTGLRRCLRLCAEFFEVLGQTDDGSMDGWFYGCAPKNATQTVWSLLTDITTEMGRSIAEFWELNPRLRPILDDEAAQYANFISRPATPNIYVQ
jgi:hypothetical protein